MTYLLDTSAFAWFLLEPSLLSRAAKKAIQQPENGLCFSAASLFEIATKVRIGKWPQMSVVMSRLNEMLLESGIELVAIAGPVALLAGQLAQKHKDPFDRLIAAQALYAQVPVISPDREFDAFGVQRIW